MSSRAENLVNASPIVRSNLTAHDPRPQALAQNVGHGITATLTKNIFNRSFPDWIKLSGQFKTFIWAPMKIVGQGVKNIQWGTKETETFVEYKVGDVIALKIKERPKVYESRIGDFKIRIQVSLDKPPHFHVDKFLDAGEYIQFINDYTSQDAQAMGMTVYQMMRFFFLSSCFGACLPQREYDKLLLKTLSYGTEDFPSIDQTQHPLSNDVGIYSPTFKFLIQHRDHLKGLSDEMNKKITNIYVFDVDDIIYTVGGPKFNPYKPWNPKGGNQVNGLKRLANCLVPKEGTSEVAGVGVPSGSELPLGTGNRRSREKSLKAFEIILVDIAKRTEKPSYMWWQGFCGNVSGVKAEEIWNNANYPTENNLYPANKGTTIMDKPMSKRPMLLVTCTKENRILVMSKADYDDFTSGAYEGWFGAESMGKINFGRVQEMYSEIITIDDMPCGHALILDKRMIAWIPHLDTSGTDTVMQRLVTMNTIHKWIIFGLFDQFVGVRVQMVGYTGSAIDMQNVFFQFKDVQLATNAYGVQ